MSRLRLAALLALLLSCFAWTTSVTAQRRNRAPAGEPFVVGVLRADGVVLPFATWDGRGWASEWPQRIADLEMPINVESIPEKWWGGARSPRTLALWSEGQRKGEITITEPAMVSVMCDRRLGLRTSTVSSVALPPPFEPLPKQGLVTSGPDSVDAIARVSTYAPEFKALGTAIVEAAEDAENDAAKRFTAWTHPFSRDARRKVPVELEALYRVSMDEPGWGSASYIEGVKRYPVRQADEGCGLVTSINGWIRYPPNGKPKYDLSARITYCDRRGVTYMLPLGSMLVEGHQYWLFQTSGWRGEWYSVVRPSSKAIEYHVDYFAGRGCPE